MKLQLNAVFILLLPIALLQYGCSSENERLIRIEAPVAYQEVQSTLLVKGEARGFWYFEATFPVTVEDLSGKILLNDYIEADGDWMTEDFVPFQKSFNFSVEQRTEAVFIARKSNASGLPEHDAEVRIPIVLLP